MMMKFQAHPKMVHLQPSIMPPGVARSRSFPECSSLDSQHNVEPSNVLAVDGPDGRTGIFLPQLSPPSLAQVNTTVNVTAQKLRVPTSDDFDGVDGVTRLRLETCYDCVRNEIELSNLSKEIDDIAASLVEFKAERHQAAQKAHINDREFEETVKYLEHVVRQDDKGSVGAQQHPPVWHSHVAQSVAFQSSRRQFSSLYEEPQPCACHIFPR